MKGFDLKFMKKKHNLFYTDILRRHFTQHFFLNSLFHWKQGHLAKKDLCASWHVQQYFYLTLLQRLHEEIRIPWLQDLLLSMQIWFSISLLENAYVGLSWLGWLLQTLKRLILYDFHMHFYMTSELPELCWGGFGKSWKFWLAGASGNV